MFGWFNSTTKNEMILEETHSSGAAALAAFRSTDRSSS